MLALTERRLQAEWQTLQELAELNPGRITGVRAAAGSFHLHLHGPAAAPADPRQRAYPTFVHVIRIDFPVHFPAVPMELFLETPVFHPNVHPETGFVCLWQQHRSSHTVEHALHKTAAMLAGELRNDDAVHVMQPEALTAAVQTATMPLRGIHHKSSQSLAPESRTDERRRIRLA